MGYFVDEDRRAWRRLRRRCERLFLVLVILAAFVIPMFQGHGLSCP